MRLKTLFITAIAILALLDPDLIISSANAQALRCVDLLLAVTNLLDFAEESLLARIGTFVLLNLTGLLQHLMQILQKADRITTAARAGQDFHSANRIQNGDDALSFLHKVFQSMIEGAGFLIISVEDLDAPSIIQQFALQLHGAANQARCVVERAILFQWIIQKAMTMVIGHGAAARLIAYANIIFLVLQYRLVRIALGLCVWSLSLLDI